MMKMGTVALLLCLSSGGVSTEAQSRRTEDEQNTIDVFTMSRAGVVHISLGGDVVTAIDVEEVSSAGQIARILLRARPGQTLTLTLFRDGSYDDVAAPLGPMHGR